MIGRTLSHFKITAKLGAGGMGEVYRAEDTKLGREVAIKVLPEAFRVDPERLARFEREARVLASLSHTNIAQIHEVGQEGATHFLVMELAEGETLAHRIGRGAIPIEEALSIAFQVAVGLEQAHEQGIVHRDLKPANIVVDGEGGVKILDFGLAKAWAEPSRVGSDSSEAPTLAAEMTQQGVVLGTAAYMSPEQANGEEADKRSDIWSFGVILEEMLSGDRLFRGPSVNATLAAVLRDPVTLDRVPPETPAAVKLLLARCLDRDRTKRLRDIGEARIGLESAIAEAASPLMTSTVAQAEVKPRWTSRDWLIGGLALVAAVTAAMMIWSVDRTGDVGSRASRLAITLPSEQQLVIGASAYPLALSPDGQRLAYVATAGGELSLFVRDLSTFDTRRVPGTEGARYPFFSPAGDWLGFFADGELRKVLVSGGSPLRICDAVPTRGASWSLDDFIYFSQDHDESGLERVAAAGGPPERIRTGQPEFDDSRHYFPHVLPDGSGLITYPRQRDVRLGGGQPQLALLDLETREWRFLVEGTQAQYIEPGFLVIHVGRGEIRVVPFDLETHEIGAQPLPALDGVYRAPDFGGAFFGVSRNGTLIYLPGGFDRQLRRVTRDGRASPLNSEVRGFRLPRLSPDGKSLAVVVDPRPSEVWVYDLEADTRTRLAHDGHNLVPIWSSDGQKITYTSNDEIVRISADGSGVVEPILQRPGAQYPGSWSSDDRHLVYWDTSSGSTDLLMLPADGAPSPLVATPANEWAARLSPNGRWLAYQSDTSGRVEVYLQSFPDGSKKRTISTTGGRVPVWASDGSELFYHDGESVFAVAIGEGTTLDVGVPEVLFAWPHGLVHEFDVFSDSKSFVMVETDPDAGPDSFRVVLDWPLELQEKF